MLAIVKPATALANTLALFGIGQSNSATATTSMMPAAIVKTSMPSKARVRFATCGSMIKASLY